MRTPPRLALVAAAGLALALGACGSDSGTAALPPAGSPFAPTDVPTGPPISVPTGPPVSVPTSAQASPPSSAPGAPAPASPPPRPTPASAPAAPPPPARSPDATPTNPAVGAVSPQHNEADVAFLRDMTPLHAAGIAMSGLAPERAGSPAVRELAARIRAGPRRDLAQRDAMAGAWGVPVPGPTATGGAATLTALSDAAFDRAFLTLMIANHEDALPFAGAESDGGTNPQAQALAQDIRITWNEEIGEMQAVLSGR